MKTSTIKKAVLSVALSAALVATVSGITYNQKVAADSFCYEAASYKADAKSNVNQRCDNISITSQEYSNNSIETFVSNAVDEEIETMDFTYNDLYSIYDENYGYVLDFSYSRGDGFVIVSELEDSETIIEMDLTHSSPYNGKNGRYIYVSFDRYYIEYDNGRNVRLTVTGEEFDTIPSTVPLKNKDKAGIESLRSYNYAQGLLFEKQIPNFYYEYSTDFCPNNDNNCANAAGVIALNYWNSYHANGLLKLSSSKLISGYNMDVATATSYMNKFYTYMNTNFIIGLFGGTTPSNCYNGFMKLISENGYVARQETVSSFDDIKYQINRGVPVFITSQDYYFTQCYTTNKAVPLPSANSNPGNHNFTIKYFRTYGIENSHTFLGFGFAEYTLYDSDGYDTKIHLVKIADGWGGERYFNYDLSDTTQWGMAAIRVSRC